MQKRLTPISVVKRLTGVPYGWKQPSLQVPRDELIALFERGVATPVYDGNEELWDKILQTLNLGLCYQTAISTVLQQGRWRGKDNPKAYVATASFRLGRGLQLPNFSDKQLGMSGRKIVQLDDDMDLDDMFDGSIDTDFSGQKWVRQAKYDSFSLGFAGHSQAAPIPPWLQRKNELDAVDWATVAEHVVSKPQKRANIARVLELRYRKLTREQAKATVTSQKEKKEIAAGWQWITRNENAISNCLKSERPLLQRESHAEKSTFVKPAEALKRAMQRERAVAPLFPGPSIMTANANRRRFELVDVPGYISTYTYGLQELDDLDDDDLDDLDDSFEAEGKPDERPQESL